MKQECSIVQDLLPLHIENLDGDATRAFVVAHLTECEECRECCERMMAEPQQISPNGSKEDFSASVKKLNRKLTHKRKMAIAAGALAALLVFLALGAAFQALVGTTDHSLELDRYSITLAQTSNGQVLLNWQFEKERREGVFVQGYNEENTVLYCDYRTALLSPSANAALKETTMNDMVARNGKLYRFDAYLADEEQRLTPRATKEITEVRQGTPDAYRVIYTAGDSIPLCDNETEKNMMAVYNARVAPTYDKEGMRLELVEIYGLPILHADTEATEP